MRACAHFLHRSGPRAILRLVATAWVGLALAIASSAEAQAKFPSKPVRIVVPFPAGGTVDVAARIVSQRLGDLLGQSVIIDNRPGANGTIGGSVVAKSAPDGHTLFAVSSTHVINPSIMAQMPFDPIKDFTPITVLGTLPLVFASGSEQPFKTLPEMIAYAKSRPGQLVLGYTDASTLLLGEMLKSAAGIDLKSVAYKGGAPMLADVIGGHIHLGATGAGSANAHYKAGNIKVLAVSENRRAVSMPDVPTVAESGVPGFNVQVWVILLGPAGLPAPIVDRLHGDIAKALSEPQVASRLVDAGTMPKGSSPSDTMAALKADMEMWSAAARKAGLKPQ